MPDEERDAIEASKISGSDGPTLVDDELELDTSSTRQLEVGGRVGRYEIVEQVGAGSMGVVFAAHDPLLDRRVALKVVHPGRRGPRARERLLREARALAQLGHPNVVTINDVGVQGELVYLAMEYVEGQTLGEWLAAEPRSWSELLVPLRAAGRGLVAVHGAGLVHRDFKPDNVLMTEEGRVLVADFGIAVAATESSWPSLSAGESDSHESMLDASGPRLTQTGAMLGTPRYMAPEQFLGERADARTDQFAFCIVLWEAIYREHPFEDDTMSLLAMSTTMGKRRSPPAAVRVPKWIQRALERGLSTKRGDRFASMRMLLEALEPRPRRRGWRAAGVGAVLSLSVAGWWLGRADEEQAEVSCEGEALAAEVWNEARAEGVIEALASTGVPLAEASQGEITGRLDRYRDAWVSAYQAECQARARLEPEARSLSDRRLACLDQRLASLGSVVEVLQQAEGSLVDRSVDTVLGLDPPGTCTDNRLVADAAALPEDPHARARVQQLQSRIQQVWVFDAAGLQDKAMAETEQIVAEARALDHAPILAEALLVRGVVLRGRGELPGAEAELERAVALATEAGMDEVVMRCAIELAGLAVDLDADVEASDRWLRHADAATARLGRPARLQALYLKAAAAVMRGYGRVSETEPLLREALELVDDQDDLIVAQELRRDLARVEAHRGDYDGAIERLTAVHLALEEALGSGHPRVIDVLTTMQELHRQRGDLEQARAIDERIGPLLEAAYGPTHPTVAITLARRGTLLAAQGELEAGLSNLDRAVELFEQRLGPDHHEVAGILGNRGILLSLMGRYDEAVADQRRVLRITEASHPADSPRMAIALDNLGSALVDAGEPTRALPLHERALVIWEATAEGSPSLGISLTDHGRARLLAGQARKAVPLLERAVELFAATDFDPAELARARFLLARALRASRRRADRARELAEQAREVYFAQGIRAAAEVEVIDVWLAEGSTD